MEIHDIRPGPRVERETVEVWGGRGGIEIHPGDLDSTNNKKKKKMNDVDE